MAGFEGQRIQSPEIVGAISLSDEIYSVVGNTATEITKPVGMEYEFLIIQSKTGTWNIRAGHVAADMTANATTFPEGATDLVTGNASLGLVAGEKMVITAINKFTVKGYDAGSLIYYYI